MIGRIRSLLSQTGKHVRSDAVKPVAALRHTTMSRDRLAAARARRQQASAQAHEMENVSSLQEGIERINANVAQIAILHARIMSVMDPGQTNDVAQLDQLADDTRSLSNNLKERIKALERTPVGPNAQIRKNRIAFVRAKFLEAIQNYQRVELEYRVKSRQRVERQLKIGEYLNTSSEVAAVEEGGGQQIFAQALTSSSRYGESRMAFREVQERQRELKKMERTLTELAQLFVDMGTLIEQQEEAIETVETTAKHVEQDTEKATEHMWKAVLSGKGDGYALVPL
ncbi:hypothetical protein D9615_003890 [Tricholomella constricta]|uniref:t-SNARE coiled-coil homology domain-containing protein n=1 Tax=Tricholomella constricta TaxID=117010 RepID=A0A8H5HD17_9AGAR|nr:hypothetical protein D9615_003890 [Tricholomella constricta]